MALEEKGMSSSVDAELISFCIQNSAELFSKDDEIKQLNHDILALSQKLEQYQNKADKLDYTVAIASGLLCGTVDSLFADEFSLENCSNWGKEKAKAFVQKSAKAQGYTKDDLEGAIRYLESGKKLKNGLKGFGTPSDSVTSEFGGGLQHHLRDFAHHPTIVGLAFSLLTQFTGKCYGTTTSGAFLIVDAKNTEFIGKTLPEKLLFGVVYWAFHLISDLAGSSSSPGEGTGIPGPMLSLFKEFSALPIFNQKDSENKLSLVASKLFNGTLLAKRDAQGKIASPNRVDLRTEVGIGAFLGKQAFAVMLNESIVKGFYFVRQLIYQIKTNNIAQFEDLLHLDWAYMRDFKNRSITRMLSVASLTFSAADLSDAAIRAAIESAGNYVLFGLKFISKVNYIGVAKSTIAVVKEVSYEQKELQLLREKRILVEAKTDKAVELIQRYRAELEAEIDKYLAEDLEQFILGYSNMDEALKSGDSDRFISGNVVIQRVLGKELQFTNQKEFDALMESDDKFVL